MGDLTESLTPSTATPTNTTPYSRPLPVREDCWSEEATSTLVDAWGRRYLELNRGNLRQKDWQDVADAVNAVHALSKKTHRTDVQCKNRIDTIKKKYKIEKARLTFSNGTQISSWLFFERMDALIGNNVKPFPNFSPKLSQSPPVAVPLAHRKSVSVNNNNINNNNNSNNHTNGLALTPIPAAAVVALPQKRGYNTEGFYRNYSAVAAAAAAVAAESEEEEEAEEEAEEEENENENEENTGVRKLAKAIERFGEVYERVEAEKLRHMVELEKQRMQFASDLEMQRLRMFTEMQVQLERNKQNKRSGSNGFKNCVLL